MLGFRIPLAGFRIPKPWIPDSTDQNYLDSGFRITLHGAKESILRGVTALTRAVSGEKQIYSGNLEILPGIGKPGKFFGKYEIFSGH